MGRWALTGDGGCRNWAFSGTGYPPNNFQMKRFQRRSYHTRRVGKLQGVLRSKGYTVILSMNPFFRCLLLYVPFLILDLISSVLAVRRVFTGRGSSGIPIVGPVVYLLVLFTIRSSGIPVSAKVIAFVSASLAHVAL